jgi:hypothetical protein
MTSIELKEQMKVLKAQQKENDKKLNAMKKEYDLWKGIMARQHTFCYVNNYADKYPSFEELVIQQNWKNTRFNPTEWEFLFTELKYTDADFFSIFMGWNTAIQNICWSDRKCSICLEYYTKDRTMNKFVNCGHYCCNGCYKKLPKENGHRKCVICRESEAPK